MIRFSEIKRKLASLFGRKDKPVLLKYAMPGRELMLDTASYFIGTIGRRGRMVRLHKEAMSFWEAKGIKERLNCGRRDPVYFVLDYRRRIVSTIDRKLMTVAAAA